MAFFIKSSDHLKATSLVGMLNQRLSGFAPARSHKRVHASDLTKEDKEFCPREYAITDLTKKERKGSFITAAMQVAFDNGNDLHDRVRDDWLRDSAVGNWKCRHCNHLVAFSKTPKIGCPKCGDKRWQYDEINLVDDLTGVSGSIDFIVDMGEPKHIMVEIKSMDKDAFNALEAPLSEHRVRTNLYLELLARSSNPIKHRINQDVAIVLYVSKAFGVKHADLGKVLPFKEFRVKKGTAPLTAMLERAEELKKFRDKTVPMPATKICPTAVCKRAKECGVAAECFSGVF